MYKQSHRVLRKYLWQCVYAFI